MTAVSFSKQSIISVTALANVPLISGDEATARFGPGAIEVINQQLRPPSMTIVSVKSHLQADWADFMVALSTEKDKDGNYDSTESNQLLISILKRNPDFVHARDEKGRMPLQYLAFFGRIELVKTMLNYSNPDLNAQDNQGLTPLHLTCFLSTPKDPALAHIEISHYRKFNQTLIATELLKRGCDATLKNKEGKTAWVTANVNGRNNLFDICGLINHAYSSADKELRAAIFG